MGANGSWSVCLTSPGGAPSTKEDRIPWSDGILEYAPGGLGDVKEVSPRHWPVRDDVSALLMFTGPAGMDHISGVKLNAGQLCGMSTLTPSSHWAAQLDR
jgi:hypothetical protein